MLSTHSPRHATRVSSSEHNTAAPHTYHDIMACQKPHSNPGLVHRNAPCYYLLRHIASLLLASCAGPNHSVIGFLCCMVGPRWPMQPLAPWGLCAAHWGLCPRSYTSRIPLLLLLLLTPHLPCPVPTQQHTKPTHSLTTAPHHTGTGPPPPRTPQQPACQLHTRRLPCSSSLRSPPTTATPARSCPELLAHIS